MFALEHEIPPFLDWFLSALILYLPVALFMLAAFGWAVSFVIAVTRRGPVEGFYSVAKVIASGVSDLAHMSLRRTLAMTMLAVRESIRRKVLIAFAVFVVVMLLAGWYLDVKSDQPARLYLSFVLTSSSYLVIGLALLLSSFSLPADFKSKTIYTIVTKPVRPIEIVVGRILGFVAVGTVLLAAMCLLSYAFVVRGLQHEHGALEMAAVESDGGSSEGERTVASGRTSADAHHHHNFTLRENGEGETDLVMGHWHKARQIGDGPIEISPPVGTLRARVPKRGKLHFLDRSGQIGEGVNVGHEWAYRSYIEGGTLAAAVWTFEGMTAERYPDGINLELDVRVFRTHMGQITKGIRGSIFVKNPKPTSKIRSSEEIPFTAKEFVVDSRFIPRELKAMDEEGVVHDVDLFTDLADEGKLEIWIQCSDPGQYFGMAQADVYILESDASFAVNFVKGFMGIWIQMLLVTIFGVMFSTFLSAPIAMIATLASVVIGYQGEFIGGVATGELHGGGPLESLIRILTQQNLTSDMDIGHWPTRVIQGVDVVFMKGMQVASNVLPNYRQFDTTEWVAYGYNIQGGLLSINMLTALTYFAVVAVVGYFFLKTREVAA
ncbi:MAG: ABC transporter permease [Pirellulaceae bacterium]